MWENEGANNNNNNINNLGLISKKREISWNEIEISEHGQEHSNICGTTTIPFIYEGK